MAFQDNSSVPPLRDKIAITGLIFAFFASFLWPGLPSTTLIITTLACTLTAFLITSPTHLVRLFTPRRDIVFYTILTMTLLAAWLSFRAITSDIPARGLATLASYLLPITTAFAVMGISPQPQDKNIRRLTQSLQIIITSLAGWSILCAVLPPLHPWLGSLGRAEWPFVDANHLAMVMNAGIFLTLAQLQPTAPEEKQKTQRFIFLSTLGLCTLGLLATGSRGGLLGLIFGAFLFCILYPGLRFTKKISLSYRLIFSTLIGIVIIGAIPFLFPGNWMAMTGLIDLFQDPSTALGSRPDLWSATLSLIMDRPWLGYGTGSFSSVFPQAMTPAHLTSAYAAHNDFLQIVLEAGIIGGTLYLALPILVLIRAFILSRTTNAPTFIPGMAAMLAALFLQAQIEFMWSVLPVLILVGIGIGIILRAPFSKEKPVTRNFFGPFLHRSTALLLLISTSVSIAGVYAEYTLKRAEHYLTQGDLQHFADDLHTARAFSFDLHAVPYARAADYRLTLLMAGPLSNGPTPEDIQSQITAALERDPYLPMAYELQGRLDEVQGKSPLPAWEKGLLLEPRSASLRLALLRYHEKRGHAEDIQKLAKDTAAWQGLRGPVSTLMNALAPYEKKEKSP